MMEYRRPGSNTSTPRDNTTYSAHLLEIVEFIHSRIGHLGGNHSNSSSLELPKPTAVANYVIVLFFLFPVVVMTIMCLLRLRVNALSRQDKRHLVRREYLYRVHSMASQAPAALEASEALTNGHLSRHASSNNSRTSDKSNKSDSADDLIKPV